ncbi:conserved hypothetical protein [Xanthomonas citri pv. citri]|nr:conserved hypothetical protein [Xanthomonas citri pv. citri]
MQQKSETALASQLRRLDAVLTPRRCQRSRHHRRRDPFGRIDAKTPRQERAECAKDDTADVLAGARFFAFAANQAGPHEGERGEADLAQIAFQLALDAVVEDARLRVGAGRGVQHEDRGALRAGGARDGERVIVVDTIERVARAGLFHRAAQRTDGRFHARCRPVIEPFEVDHLVAQLGVDLRQRPPRDRDHAGATRIAQQLLQHVPADQAGRPCQQDIHQAILAISALLRRRSAHC